MVLKRVVKTTTSQKCAALPRRAHRLCVSLNSRLESNQEGDLEEHFEVDVRLPENGNSNSHGARPVHPIITMIEWIRTSRLSIKNSLSVNLEERLAAIPEARGLQQSTPRCTRRSHYILHHGVILNHGAQDAGK
jgi:hypothetical protein